MVIANDDEGSTSTGEGYVDPTPVGDEANRAIVVGTHGAKDDGLLFSALETIGRAHFDEWRASLTKKLAREATDEAHLSGVGSDHGDLRWWTASINQSTDGIAGSSGLGFVELGNAIVHLDTMINGYEGNGKLLTRPGEARERTTLGRRHTIQELASVEEVRTEHGDRGVHTILRIKHEGWYATGNHSGKQRDAETFLFGSR
jgi:hypothetical protein